MSFILDALKKSENERQRHVGPSLADVQVSRRERERPWWAVAVAALLVINIGVLIVVLMRGNGEAQPSAMPSPQERQAVAPAPPPSIANAPTPRYEQPEPVDPAVRSLADEAGAPETEDALAEETARIDHATASAAAEGGPLVRRIEPEGSVSTTPAQAASSQEVLPTHNDLVASGTSLPELHLDIHVHSANPTERFVFVNMRKYVEGQALSEGPTVERITREGVVLNQRGLRFLLPRQ